jgi:hypothetical protein
LPFTLDWRTLASGLNFTLTTRAGDIDLLGEIAGIGTFRVAARLADRMEVYDRSVNVLSLVGAGTGKASGRASEGSRRPCRDSRAPAAERALSVTRASSRRSHLWSRAASAPASDSVRRRGPVAHRPHPIRSLRRDAHHAWAREALIRQAKPWLTCESVLSRGAHQRLPPI